MLRRNFISLSIIACFLAVGVFVFAAEQVRPPAVAGTFYPSDADQLALLVDRLLMDAPVPAKREKPVCMLIVPHAGYAFSGSTAAAAYRIVSEETWEMVILLGPCHRSYFKGASLWPEGAWETPLGDVSVDSGAAKLLLRDAKTFSGPWEAHLGEHSLEVQLPFLQKTVQPLKIVPILVREGSADNIDRLARAIVKAIDGKKALIVISSDFSHYRTAAETARRDALALDFIEKGDEGGLREALVSGKCEMCGDAAVLTGLRIATLLGLKSQALLHGDSGDATRDKERVVGYAAVAFYPKELTGSEKKLLRIARAALEDAVSGRQSVSEEITEPELLENKAVFVTLKKKGILRGCMGSLSPVEPLHLAVRAKTIEAASRDLRFRPVSADELAEIDIEITVLGPLRPTTAESIVIEREGIAVKRGGTGGVFLPQVARETGWNKERLLDTLCSEKAGLTPGAWRKPGTNLYAFTTREFGEKDA